MSMRSGFSFLSLVALTAAASPQTVEPLAKGIQDNSFLIEEAYNQESGVAQHILNVPVFFTGRHEEVPIGFTQEWPIFSQTHQFSYTIPYTFVETNKAGFEDLRLNYHLQALIEGERTPAFAPRISLVVPAGDRDIGFGHGRLGYEVNLPFSKIVADRWTVHFNTGGSIFSDVDGHNLTNFNLGCSAIYAVSRNLNFLVESVGLWEEDVVFARKVERSFAALISPGVRYAFNLPNNAQLVIGLAVPLGLTSDSPDWAFSSTAHSSTRLCESNIEQHERSDNGDFPRELFQVFWLAARTSRGDVIEVKAQLRTTQGVPR